MHKVLVNCFGGLLRNSVDRLTDRTRNDLKCVEGPQNTNTTPTRIFAAGLARAICDASKGVASSSPAGHKTFVEIDCEIIATVIPPDFAQSRSAFVSIWQKYVHPDKGTVKVY